MPLIGGGADVAIQPAVSLPNEKPLRISVTVSVLVLNVDFQVDMLPRLRKTGLQPRRDKLQATTFVVVDAIRWHARSRCLMIHVRISRSLTVVVI